MVGQHSLPSHTYARIFEVHAAGAEKEEGSRGPLTRTFAYSARLLIII